MMTAFHRQRGVTLFVALIAIVALGLATVALFRTVGGSLLVANNLSMKRATTSAADFGVESARNWLLSGGVSDLTASVPASGYYADWAEFTDPLNATWNDTNSRAVTGHVHSDETIRVVIHRMCESTGAATEQACVMVSGSSAGSTTHVNGYGDYTMSTEGRVYYRVTARIQGIKNTVSFVQTVFY